MTDSRWSPPSATTEGGNDKAGIPPIDHQAEELARKRWDRLTKPQGSLGRLEELGTRIAGMTGQPLPSIRRKVIFTVAGDHGVAAEGVSAFPQEVTPQMVANFLAGGAGINVLAAQVGAQVLVVDAGVAVDPASEGNGLLVRKIRRGTGNIVREPAMSRVEAEKIVEAGRSTFEEAHEKDRIDLVGLGDMGIANTTPAAALAAVLTGSPVSWVTGRGTGINDRQREHKIQVIERALALHCPNSADPIDGLAKVGGFEIGFLAGIALAAASLRVPVMLDGFLTTVSGLLASRIAPGVERYLIASHRSVEPGHTVVLKALGLEPLLDLHLRLGEGTGAALGFFLVESALALLSKMATFADAGVAER